MGASALAHGAMDDAPTGAKDEAPPVWDADKVRAVAQVNLDRGGVILTVAAVAGSAADAGTIAAYTELVLRDPSDIRALQLRHRGRPRPPGPRTRPRGQTADAADHTKRTSGSCSSFREPSVRPASVKPCRS